MINTFNGYKLVANPNLVKSRTVEVVKSRWEKFWDVVVRWNPCNAHLTRPDFETISEPSDEVIIMENVRTMVAHPAVIAKLKQAIKEKS
jgi:hypothetical protein